MEETKVKRKGYKTQAQQTEASRRYRASEQGKEKTKIANYKSKGKVFIKEYSTFEDLKEYETLIVERKEVLKKK